MAGQGSRSAMLVLLGTVAVVLLSCRGAAAKTYLVGNTTWEIPSDPLSYDEWSASQQFIVGDYIEFKYDKNNHNVASLDNSTAFDQCDLSQAKSSPISGDTKIKLKTPGTMWYACEVEGHCDLGMKVQIVVLSQAGAPMPAVAPTAGGPPGSGTLAVAPAPANAAVPRFGTAIGYGSVAAMVISAASFFL